MLNHTVLLIQKNACVLENCKFKNVKHIAVGGGVSLNSRLRERFINKCLKLGLSIYFPSPNMCIDNAAMIAGLGYEKMIRNSLDISRTLLMS